MPSGAGAAFLFESYRTASAERALEWLELMKADDDYCGSRLRREGGRWVADLVLLDRGTNRTEDRYPKWLPAERYPDYNMVWTQSYYFPKGTKS